MNRRSMKIAGFTAVVAIATGAFCAEIKNLVQNPGFETDAKQPSAWEVAEKTNGGDAAIDEKVFHGGKYSLRIDQPKLNLPAEAEKAENLVTYIGDNKAGGFVMITQDVPVQAGKSYDFKFWYKASGLLAENRKDLKQGYVHLQVWIFWMKEKGQSVDGDNSSKYRWVLNEGRDSSEWVEVVNKAFGGQWEMNDKPCVAPAGAKFAHLRFQLSTNAGGISPKVWLDDVSFDEVK